MTNISDRNSKRTLTIMISGGLAKSFWSMGVILNLLQRKNIEIVKIIGVSGGAIVGVATSGLLTIGVKEDTLEQLVEKLNHIPVLDLCETNLAVKTVIANLTEQKSILDGSFFSELFQHPVLNLGLTKGTLPVFTLAYRMTSLEPNNQEETGIQHSPHGTTLFELNKLSVKTRSLAVAASCALPLLFEPIRIGSHDYVDGAFGMPIPLVHPICSGSSDLLILDTMDGATPNIGIVTPLMQIVATIMSRKAIQDLEGFSKAKRPDLQMQLLKPSGSPISPLSFDNASIKENIIRGYVDGSRLEFPPNNLK